MTQEIRKTRWGYDQVLATGEGFKIKLLHLEPTRTTSLQYHEHRDEYWVVLNGFGVVIVEGESMYVETGDTIRVNKTIQHKIIADSVSPLEILEIQTGEICEETDIIRLENIALEELNEHGQERN